MTFIKLNIIKLDIKLVGWGTKIIESGPKKARPTNEQKLTNSTQGWERRNKYMARLNEVEVS